MIMALPGLFSDLFKKKNDRSSDFITVILPNGVKYRLFHNLIRDLTSCIFFTKVYSLHAFEIDMKIYT